MTSKQNYHSRKDIKDFEEAARPLMEFMIKNCSPHHVAIVDCMGAQLMSGEMGVPSSLAIKYREEKNDLVR